MLNERTFDPARADRLDDPERLVWLPPAEVIAGLEVRAGEDVADVGAGTGYFAFPMAEAVAPGRVYAVDLQAEMLARLRTRLGASAVENIIPITGSAVATTLRTGSCNLAFFGNVWHELDDHAAVLVECARILVPHGRIGILDWRPDSPPPPGPPSAHRLAATTVRKTLETTGWKVEKAVEVGAYHYLVTAGR